MRYIRWHRRPCVEATTCPTVARCTAVVICVHTGDAVSRILVVWWKREAICAACRLNKSASLLTTCIVFRVAAGEPIFRYGNCFSGASRTAHHQSSNKAPRRTPSSRRKFRGKEWIGTHALSNFPRCILRQLPVSICRAHGSGSMASKQRRKPRLSDEEYEDAYREALYCLRESTFVGEPLRSPDGIRVCRVDDALLDDDQVLEKWWGKEIAQLNSVQASVE